MDFLAQVRERAARLRPRIVFPEANDGRIQEAARALRRDGLAQPVLLGDAGGALAALCGEGIEIVDPRADPRRARVAEDIFRARAHKGMSPESAMAMAADPLLFAADMVRHGEAGASVAGCATPTADVVRAALWLVGLAPGVRTASSAFYMVVRPFRGGDPEVLSFADCAVVPYPTDEQLADIALAAARDRRRIVGDEPVIAFLSFSTRGSGEGESVERVRRAAALVRTRAPALFVDGELQADAALIASVAGRKAPGSAVAGSANVLIFPGLDAGNIAYKLVERLGGALAIGPILQGFASPCADLSRGADVGDIINAAAVAALQTQPCEV